MSQSSNEWRHFMADSMSPTESRFANSLPGTESANQIQNNQNHNPKPQVPEQDSPAQNQLPTEKSTKKLSGSSDTSSDIHSSQLLASPSGPPPGVRPDDLKAFSETSRHKKKHSMQSNQSSNSLIHTDSESSQSVDISIPYYNISNYSQSVNTFNMLAKMESKTGHSQRSANSSRLAQQSSSGKNSHKDSYRNSHQNSSLNQVPPRFSQFILDQKAPSANSSVPHASTGQRDIGNRVSANRPNNDCLRRRSSRDISASMDSQVTIFSTKPEEMRQSASSRWAGVSVRRRSGKNKFNDQNGTTAKVDNVSNIANETSSTLKRTKAVRYSGAGSRLRTYLRQLYYRLKKRLAFTFSAGPKRASSTVKMNRQKTLVRKKRANPRNKSVRRNLAKMAEISGPLENPNFTGAARVENLTDDLKRSAGADIDPQITDMCNERLGKYNHLSNFIQEQRHLSQNVANPPSTVFSETSSAPPPPPHGNRERLDQVQAALGPNVMENDVKGAKRSGQTTVDQPKSDPVVEAVLSEEERCRLQRTWNSYLSNVVSQRIRLRQEIFLFQSILAQQPVPDFFVRHSDAITSDLLSRSSTRKSLDVARTSSMTQMPHLPMAVPSKAETEVMETPEYEASMYSSEATSISSMSDGDNVSEFQKVLNRRSMLGDMLSYDSEEFDSEDTLDITDSNAETKSVYTSSTYPSRSIAPSSKAASNIADSLIHVERYGTVSRHSTMPRRSPTKSSVYSSSVQGSTYLITRSPGIARNLCEQN